jgi:hypothetical protein
MKPMKTIVLAVCLAGLLPLAVGQTKAPKKITAAEAKDHVGETVVVCGTAVDTHVTRYAIGDRGKPVEVDLDQPQPNQIFYFVTFSADLKKPQLVDDMYKGKQVCVTGEVSMSKVVPFIMVTDTATVKIQADAKK